MNWTSRSARSARSARFEQRLLRADVERRDLGDAVDQHLVVEPRDRVPFDHIAERVGIAPRLALDLGALGDGRATGVLILVEAAAVGIDLAVERVDLGLAGDAEAAEPFQHDVEAAVVQLLAASPIRPRQPISNRAGGSSLVPAAGPSRSAGRRPARRGPSPGSAARRCAAAAAPRGNSSAPGEREDRHAKQRAVCSIR